MTNNSNSSVSIGNIDDRVSERVLYDILIQAGRVVELHILCDKETGKPKGFAFAEYESEGIAVGVPEEPLSGYVFHMYRLTSPDGT